MKKYGAKLTAGLLTFAMTASSLTPAFAAPVNSEESTESSSEVVLSQTAQDNIAAARIISSLGNMMESTENEVQEDTPESKLKDAIKDWIFNGFDGSLDLSRFGITSKEMDTATAEVLDETNMEGAADVTYETDDEGTVTTAEVEMDPMIVMAAEELQTVYNLSEEQTQQLLGMYAQYLQLCEDNADIFGVQVPYNTTRDTNASPIGSLLDIASIPEEYAQAGYIDFETLSGIIQLYYLGTQFAVSEYADEIRDGRDEALDVLEDGMTEMQEYLALNDWLADNCQFAMDYIMEEMVEPEPAENKLYTYAYNCMYNTIKQQVYDGTYDALKDVYGEEQAKNIADAQAESYMVDVQEDGGSGEQQAASTASAIVGMWGSNQVGVFVNQKAVCFGYANVYAYLLQCAHPEIYLKDKSAGLDDASNWKSYKELNYELDSDGNPVKDEDGNYKWSKDAAAVADYVKIIFDADVTMFGQDSSFGECHYWNAVKLDGKWYYVDPCYVDIYVECMNRDRVETDGNLNHLYFMFSDDSCREMYEDNYKEIRTLYEGIATDTTYEEAWVAFVKSQPYQVGNKIYYLYDSTDLLDIMRNYGNGGSSSRAANDYEGLFTDTEYKIAYHDNASMSDTSDDLGTLVDFNNGQVYNPTSEEMEDNELIAELFEEHQAYVEGYPSISISCAYYNDKIYFSLSNCILSYDIKTGDVEKLIEYTEVSGKRDMSNGLGGLAFTMTSGNPGTNGITVENPPIADMTIKRDGNMYVSVATNYAFISGKDFGELKDYSSYGYQFAETNYEPSYNSYYNNSEANDNDEFMWSANIVGTIAMSHLTGGSHSYKNVSVPASCTEDSYTVKRCSDCGLIQETATVENKAQTVNAAEAKEGYAILEIDIKTNVDGEQKTLTSDVIEVDQVKEAEETEHIFSSETIEAKAQEMISQEKGYTLDEYKFENVTVKYGSVETVTLTATKEAEQATATLSVEIKDGTGEDAQLLQSGTLTAEGVKGEPHTFAATEIQAKAEEVAKKLSENYVLDEYDYKDVDVAYGATETVSLTASKVQATATLAIEIKDGTGEDAQLLQSGTLTAEGVKGEPHTFAATEIQAKAEEVAKKLSENYILDEYDYKDVDVAYGATETVSLTATKEEAEQATATLAIEIKDGTGEDAQLLQSGTLTAEGVKGEPHTFAATEIQAKAEEVAKKLSENYVLDEYDYKDVDVAYGATETVSLTASKVQATATLAIEIKDGTGEDAQLLQSGTLTAEGVKGEPHTFAAADIQATAEGLELPENYVLDTYDYKDVNVAYGTTETVSLTASKESATATLNITVYDSATYDAENEEDRTVLLETTAEKEGPKGDTYAFTAEDIKKAVGEIEGYTLDEDSLPTEEKYPTAVYGGEAGTVDVTATEIPTGDGHTYIKFNETYYTKNNSGNWQTGTSYVCIDCGHAFELEDDETVEDHLRSNDKVLTDDEVKSYAGKTTEVWTWSTDKTEASMYTVPTDLKDHKFDCIWENPSLSTREVATVSGDCTTGKFTAKLKNGTTESASVTAGNHSYQNQEKKDDAGNVTQEAAVQWTWADDLSTATVRFLCDVCGKTLEKTVTQEEMTSSETEDGLIKYTATVTVDDVNYISSREYNPNPFEDVAKDSYYYDAVLWAVKNDITSGKDETHFAPNDDCTRAQVVTFLWRAMDEPEPKTTENPFVDVKEDKYYYKAVLWAAENGITSGIDETHFAPNDTVTRGQFVTFLHRNEGEPKPNITENPFVDVNESKYYYDAVLWAYENEITKGTDETHFKPESGCTRGQVVTFLYRAYGDEE